MTLLVGKTLFVRQSWSVFVRYSWEGTLGKTLFQHATNPASPTINGKPSLGIRQKQTLASGNLLFTKFGVFDADSHINVQMNVHICPSKLLLSVPHKWEKSEIVCLPCLTKGSSGRLSTYLQLNSKSDAKPQVSNKFDFKLCFVGSRLLAADICMPVSHISSRNLQQLGSCFRFNATKFCCGFFCKHWNMLLIGGLTCVFFFFYFLKSHFWSSQIGWKINNA